MLHIKRPMLAPLNSPADTPSFFDDIVFPQMVSPKIDGIRALVCQVPEVDFTTLDSSRTGAIEHAVLSRNMERFRSNQVKELFGNPELLHCDGELAYNPIAPNCLHVTQSHVSAFNKPCETLKYYVFDYCNPETLGMEYYLRLERLERLVAESGNPRVDVLPQIHVDTVDELLEIEKQYLNEGYEGIMFRNPVGHYKQNRATYRENLIYKLKRFKDAEAMIIGFIEGENNTNVQERDARGFAKRSDSKAGKVANGMVGKIIVRHLHLDKEFLIAPGVLTHAQRRHIWENQDKFLNRVVTFRYFDYGMKDEYRFARFIAFREKWDM